MKPFALIASLAFVFSLSIAAAHDSREIHVPGAKKECCRKDASGGQKDCCKKSADGAERECCKKEGKVSGEALSGCCRRHAAGEPRECCRKHEAGDPQKCCRKGHDEKNDAKARS